MDKRRFLQAPGLTSVLRAHWVAATAGLRVGLVNLSLTFATVVIFLALTEIGLRVANGVALWPPVNLIAKDQALLTTQTANVYHSLLGWSLRPGLSVNPGQAETSFTTGEYGIRGNGIRPATVLRNAILAVGDSFTAGSEVGDGQSWPAQLEALLGEPVINAAAGGWAADQIVLRAEELAPILAPHTVIVSFLADDVLRAGYRVYGSANKPWFSIDAGGALVHHNNPVPEFTGRPSETNAPLAGYFFLPTWIMDRIGMGESWRRGYDSYVKADNDPIAVSCKLLRRARDFHGKRGTRVLFVLQYGGAHDFPATSQRSYGEPVAACAREAGIETISTYDALLERFRAGPDAFNGLYVMHDEGRLHGHMSAKGNALIAKLIAARIRQPVRMSTPHTDGNNAGSLNGSGTEPTSGPAPDDRKIGVAVPAGYDD